MLKKLIISTIAIVALAQNVSADDDYYLYGTWNIGGHNRIYDIEGFIDTNGKLGTAGDEYVVFNDSGTGYIYRVSVNGDPKMHPDNPNATGNIADRTFTFVSKSADNALQSRGGADEFYIEDNTTTGIYFGSGRGIKRWDFDWSNKSDIVGNGLYSQTLARNTTTGEWWTATGGRAVYKYNNTTNNWEYQFNYPSLAGGHHDGMEIVKNKLYLSDMTSDKIIVYDLNSTGSVENPSNFQIYSYSASPVVEGMGYGPNQHFWMSGRTAYEIGDGNLTADCTQTFNYSTNWTMQRSDCDNIKVPGFDDTIMAKMVGDKLQFATADAGAKAWLEGLDCNITVLNELTLNTGDGFWTVGKSNINKTISTGESRNNFVTLQDGVYTFIGFNVSVDLNAKFGTQPVEAVYYYDGSWKTWTPVDGSQTVNAGQGLYILPNAGFSIVVK